MWLFLWDKRWGFCIYMNGRRFWLDIEIEGGVELLFFWFDRFVFKFRICMGLECEDFEFM
ncbi:hypothetical protein WT55_01715 [Burkholderia pseudomultivorans]|nr:hypothetical protein WT55_01715 [Burkholderia pseudomultivorans]